MSESERYLRGHDETGDIAIPLIDLLGNYISYTERPASPDSEGVEGRIKTSPDGIFFYADGRWRKTPAYTLHWNDLSEDVRFLPINKDIDLTEEERQRLRDAISILAATQTVPGLVKGSSRTATYGAINIQQDSSAFVLQATATSAGVVRTTENATDGLAPMVATKYYVDTRITQQGQSVPIATATTVGGIKGGRDIQDINSQGLVLVNRATFNTGTAPSMGLVRIAPPEFTLSPQLTTYDDDTQLDYPFTVTVSQAKAIANYYATNQAVINREDYAASSNTLGFVKCKPNDGTVTIVDGEISIPHAAPSTYGVAALFNPAQPSADTTVPTMQQVYNYVQEYTGDNFASKTGVATVGTEQQAGTLGLVRVKQNDALLVAGLQATRPGELSVRLASLNTPGVVSIVNSGLSTYPASSVFNANTVLQLIDDSTATDATSTAPGIVLVSLSGAESPTSPPYIVPTVEKMQQYVASLLPSLAVEQKVIDVLLDSMLRKTVVNVTLQQISGRPTLTETLPDEKANCIVTYSEVQLMIEGGGSIVPVFPDWQWISYQSEDKELELRGNTFTISPVPDTGTSSVSAIITGNLTVTGDTDIQGSLTCSTFQPSALITDSVTVNGTVVASSFIGGSSFSIGTQSQPTILELQQRDMSLGLQDNNLVLVNGNMSVAGTRFTTYGIAAMSDSSSVKFYSDIVFDDRNVLDYGISNVGDLWSNNIYGGYIQAAALATRAASPLMPKPASLQDATLYTIVVTVNIPGVLDPIVVQDSAQVAGLNAMQRLEDIINNSTVLNQYLIAKWDQGALKVTAFRRGASFNGTTVLVVFATQLTPAISGVTMNIALSGATDQGVIPPAGDDDLLVVGGSGVFSGLVKASGFESDGQLYADEGVTIGQQLEITTRAVNIYGTSYVVKQPVFTQDIGDGIVADCGLLVQSLFKKALVVGLGVGNIDHIELYQKFELFYILGAMVDSVGSDILILAFSNPVDPSVEAGVFVTPLTRIENVIKSCVNVAVAVIPC